MAEETTQGTTEIGENDSIFSAGWQDLGPYKGNFEDNGFSADYEKVVAHCKDNNVPQTSDGVAWLALSGYSTAASYTDSQQPQQLMQGANTFTVQNLDDDGAPAAATGPIKDPYLLFKFGYYGSAKYRQIRSVIISAMEN